MCETLAFRLVCFRTFVVFFCKNGPVLKPGLRGEAWPSCESLTLVHDGRLLQSFGAARCSTCTATFVMEMIFHLGFKYNTV